MFLLCDGSLKVLLFFYSKGPDCSKHGQQGDICCKGEDSVVPSTDMAQFKKNLWCSREWKNDWAMLRIIIISIEGGPIGQHLSSDGRDALRVAVWQQDSLCNVWQASRWELSPSCLPEYHPALICLKALTLLAGASAPQISVTRGNVITDSLWSLKCKSKQY